MHTHAAWKLDRDGVAAARIDASAIKLVTAQLQSRVMDRAIEVFGAMGLSPDTPLARMWAWGRAYACSMAPTKCTCGASRATNLLGPKRVARRMHLTFGAGSPHPASERQRGRRSVSTPTQI